MTGKHDNGITIISVDYFGGRYLQISTDRNKLIDYNNPDFKRILRDVNREELVASIERTKSKVQPLEYNCKNSFVSAGDENIRIAWVKDEKVLAKLLSEFIEDFVFNYLNYAGDEYICEKVQEVMDKIKEQLEGLGLEETFDLLNIRPTLEYIGLCEVSEDSLTQIEGFLASDETNVVGLGLYNFYNLDKEMYN